ncbi:MAG TPA: hypothetical protein VLG76_08530 [Rhabdochlamydiaceae bacterium]|nr:hypothetical protein [Rhabdochlamydiaceae bacterium]
MTITEISLISIASSLIILVLFFVGILIGIQRSVSVLKRDFHSITLESKATIHKIKDLTVGSLKFLATSKNNKKAKKTATAMNWLAIGITLFDLATKYFKKHKRLKKR